MRRQFSLFRTFLDESNALALAVGVILGGALGTVVNSLVADIIMPPIGVALGGVDFSSLAIPLGGDAAIRYGAFVNALIAFLVISYVVFWISRMFIRPAVAEPAAPSKTCPFCRESIHADASRCRHCGSDLSAAAQSSGPTG